MVQSLPGHKSVILACFTFSEVPTHNTCIDILLSHPLFTAAQSRHILPPFTFPEIRSVSEDADADTVSIHSKSSSPNTDSVDTALQNTDDEDEDFEASSNDSRPPSPDTALAHSCNEWLPTATQAGYFVFPDPFSTGERTGSAPEPIEAYSAVPSGNKKYTIEDRAAPRDIPRAKRAEQSSTALLNENEKRFLPLLKDEPNYPRNPTLNRGLEKINQRLTRATQHAEERPSQPSEIDPIPGVHPAFRQAESSSDVNIEELTALKAEIRQLKADVKALERSATSTDSGQAEAVRHLHRNQERLVRGWEKMRDDLFHIKVMQERLRRRVNLEHNMEGRW